MMDIKGLASMVNKVFDKKVSGGGVKSGNMLSQELAEELYKPSIRKLKKRKVHSSFIDNIWHVELADMQLITKFNKGFLLCVIDIYSWVVMSGLFLY